ncbi:hypothetical protein [Streptomyces sp. URMC 124]|uniref:hypothetical protein n=1 Tax=Streptomyces sp. URMC 124 TaxID=3423405 RepID=UPI003F1D8A53
MPHADPADVPGTPGRTAARCEKVRPEPALAPQARGADAFPRRPPVPLPVIPARELLRRRVASLACAAPPSSAHEPYGRQAPSPHVVARRLRAAGGALRTVPAGVRRQLPPPHILRTAAGLGPGSRPSSYNLHRRAAILDGPGEARGIDGGGGAGWRKPG